MSNRTTRIILLCLLPLAHSCKQFENQANKTDVTSDSVYSKSVTDMKTLSDKQHKNHRNDGLYVGATMIGAVAWVINGNEVKVYSMGVSSIAKIEHHDGYVVAENGQTGVRYISSVEYDSVTGKKSLVMGSGTIELKLERVSERTDISELEISKITSAGWPFMDSESGVKEEDGKYSVESPEVETYLPENETSGRYDQKAKWEPKKHDGAEADTSGQYDQRAEWKP